MKTPLIIIVSMLLGAMCAPYMAQAIDRQEQAERKLIERHKAYVSGYLDNQDNINDIDDDVVYQTSAQRKAAKHANEFLRASRSGDND